MNNFLIAWSFKLARIAIIWLIFSFVAGTLNIMDWWIIGRLLFLLWVICEFTVSGKVEKV
jgi:hypothetical protein